MGVWGLKFDHLHILYAIILSRYYSMWFYLTQGITLQLHVEDIPFKIKFYTWIYWYSNSNKFLIKIHQLFHFAFSLKKGTIFLMNAKRMIRTKYTKFSQIIKKQLQHKSMAPSKTVEYRLSHHYFSRTQNQT